MRPYLPPFLTEEETQTIAERFDTPTFVYSEEILRAQASEVLAFRSAFGFRARYAMKANPHRRILQLFNTMGLHVDASSGNEVNRAIKAGVPAHNILLTTQELPHDFSELTERGVQINACSLHQLNRYGVQHPGTEVSVRINPGVGSGMFSRVNVGGKQSSFGIWHEDISLAREIAQRHRLVVKRVHTHIGSGTDPDVWGQVAEFSAGLLDHFPDASVLNLGGGFKVARVAGEESTDCDRISAGVRSILERYAEKSGRQIDLEIEPGTFLVANAGIIVATVVDITSTGENGHRFLKVGMGMGDVLRPQLYGAVHPMWTIPQNGTQIEANYIVVGHCCESGDLLSTEPGHGDEPRSRSLREVKIGDLFVMGGVGAYCSSMNTSGYNSFDRAAEVIKTENGGIELITRRQTWEECAALEY